MTTLKAKTDVLDPKFAPDLASYTASLGALHTAPTLSRATSTEMVLTTPAEKPAADDFAQKEPPTRVPDSDTLVPLPDPQFGIDDGIYPIYGTNGVDIIDGTDAGDII